MIPIIMVLPRLYDYYSLCHAHEQDPRLRWVNLSNQYLLNTCQVPIPIPGPGNVVLNVMGVVIALIGVTTWQEINLNQ